MNSFELRQNFLKFFKERGHTVVPSSSLLPSDPTVLFTTAGMQQFKDFFIEAVSPYGTRTTSSQKCFRTSDIDETGDVRHLTFFEMLGNFSFGDYFKEGAIKYALEFLVNNLGIKKEKLWFSIFKGVQKPSIIPKDLESQEILENLGIPKEKVFEFGMEDNFWGPTGTTGPCGPTCEIHYELTQKSCKRGKLCAPNCDCGRFIELWNLVFNEFYKTEKGELTKLKQPGVDTGMGLERLVMVNQEKDSIFETDLFQPIIQEIQTPKPFPKANRVIADHIKGSVFLISEGIVPSNIEQGYVLRRILRRAIRFGKLLDLPKNFLIPLAKKVVETYQDVYPEVKSKENEILTVIQNEEEKFAKTLEKGLKILNREMRVRDYKQGEKIKDIPDLSPIDGFPGFTPGKITGKWLFDFYQTFGFPLELSLEEVANTLGRKFSDYELIEIKKEFEKATKKHQKISQAGAEKKFGGVGKGAGLEAAKLHTATHLMHQALRRVLGDHVKQMGSDITSQRLRLDFSHQDKTTEQEIRKVEEIVNQKIKEDLDVKKTEISLKEALQSGALAFFKEKYPDKVTVYSIGNFSKEICAGPHVKKTSELNQFKIIKEKSSGAGVRRIKAVLLPVSE